MLGLSLPLGAQETNDQPQNSVVPQAAYKKQAIIAARFGEDQKQALLKKAYSLQQDIGAAIVGQDRMGKAMQDRVVQYLENFGTRTKDPIALHMIGLPGVGKSAMLNVLENMGVRVLKVDAQAYTGMNAANQVWRLTQRITEVLEEQKGTDAPLILLFDEIDKVAEIHKRGASIEEETSPLIGLLNQILTDGKFPDPTSGQPVELSNTFVVTAMNFSPEEMERFSKEALGAEKNFYDFSVDDFARFDEWLRKEPSARPKVLSRLFRSNTVSRLAPNTLIAKPLNLDDYRLIARMNADQAIREVTTETSAAKKILVAYTDAYLQFLVDKTVYAPSGARETVMKSGSLTQQLVLFGTKIPIPNDDLSLAQPRSLLLDYDAASGKAKVRVTTLYRKNAETLGKAPFEFEVPFDGDSKSFLQPPNLAVDPPTIPASTAGERISYVTQKDIKQARFPAKKRDLKGLAAQIDQWLIGQKDLTEMIENDLSTYVGRPGPVKKNPPFRVIAGFPGLGKSELVNLAATYAKLPVARVNMQAFSSSGAQTLEDFFNLLDETVKKARGEATNGKFIILFEELDKVFEVNPQNGAFVDRPVMNYIKDLLNNGYIEASFKAGDGTREHRTVDVRDAYNMVTMNFAVDRSGFVADPRLTSIEDVVKACERLKGSPADLKEVLGSMFLPDTVSRLMPRFMIVNALEEKDYKKIIENQVAEAVATRLHDPETGDNLGQIEVKLSTEYRRYLFNETVIPSEGARNTVISVQQKLALDLEDALKAIPRSSELATTPLIVTLDFKPGSSTVTAKASAQDPALKIKAQDLFKRKIALNFPPLKTTGKMSSFRMLVAVHEFGHAFTAVRLGRRFVYATAVSPRAGVGGYVKYAQNELSTAKALLSKIYSSLGSRAMERIFLNDSPLDEGSVLNITHGASSDIKTATKELWELMFEYGLNPSGGVIERRGMEGMDRYAHFADLPPEEVEKFGLILRKMEDHLVNDLLEAHSKDWYVEKVTDFAKIGGVDEEGFYKIIGYPHPGETLSPLGDIDRLQRVFEGSILPETSEVREARQFRQGTSGQTASENLERATQHFQNLAESETPAEISLPKPNARGRGKVRKCTDEVKVLLGK